MILLDTSVLVYAVGEAHPLREPCRRLLAAHAEGRIEACATVEVIQEFAHVRARRRPRADAVTLASHYLAAFPLLTTRAEDLEEGLNLFVRYPALGAFDAVLAAVALNRRLDALVSTDRGFAHMRGLVWLDPAVPASFDLLGL